MDWLNFLMKHGIGSPGSMAKAQAKLYKMLRQRHPAASEEEILKTMFVQRARIGVATRCREAYEMIDAPGWADAVVRSNPDLLCLTVYIILCEHAELRRVDTPADAFSQVVRVVTEALDEVAPMWRKHFSGLLDPATGERRPSPSGLKAVEESAEDSKSGLSVSCPNCGQPNDELHPKRVNHRLFVGRYECENCLAVIAYQIVIHDFFSPGGVEIVAEEAHDEEESGAVEAARADAPAIETGPSIPVLRELEPSFVGHAGRVNKVRFSPDGKYVLSCGADRTIRLWDANSRRQLRLLETAKPVESVTFVPGTWHVASADGRMIRLWDLQTSSEVSILSGHETDVSWLEADQTGAFLLSADSDTIRIWNANSGREEKRFAFDNALFMAVGFSADGRFALVSGDDLVMKLFDTRLAKVVRAFEAHTADVADVAMGPDGRRCLTGSLDMTCGLWDVSSGGLLCRLSGFNAAVGSVAFSPSGDIAVIAGDRKEAWVWDLRVNRPLCALEGNTLGVATALFSPDGELVLSGGYDGSVRLWNVRSTNA